MREPCLDISNTGNVVQLDVLIHPLKHWHPKTIFNSDEDKFAPYERKACPCGSIFLLCAAGLVNAMFTDSHVRIIITIDRQIKTTLI